MFFFVTLNLDANQKTAGVHTRDFQFISLSFFLREDTRFFSLKNLSFQYIWFKNLSRIFFPYSFLCKIPINSHSIFSCFNTSCFSRFFKFFNFDLSHEDALLLEVIQVVVQVLEVRRRPTGVDLRKVVVAREALPLVEEHVRGRLVDRLFFNFLKWKK